MLGAAASTVKRPRHHSDKEEAKDIGGVEEEGKLLFFSPFLLLQP
jgi:hypothetical protein